MDLNTYLKNIFYDPRHPASFSGPEKLHYFTQKDGKFKLSKYQVKKWLQQQEPYSLQRPTRKRFQRAAVNVSGLDDQWDMDLMDMTKYVKENNDMAFVLVVIDIFSKFLWLRSLKDKRGSTVSIALADIFKTGRQPNRIRSDKGQEFKAKPVQMLLQRRGIKHIFAQNTEVKANYAERVIKTIKTKITRYFTYKQSYRYIDKLQQFATSYNKTHHSTIDKEPISVNKNNEEEVRLSTFLSNEKRQKPVLKTRRIFRFKTGDRVRITYLTNLFMREYDSKWSGEIFTISKRFLRDNIPMYKLKDYYGDDITGSFYQPELAKVVVKDADVWKIEQVLKTRGTGRNKQLYVKWLYWPKKFNSWINASHAHNL